jgi:RNA polymerase-binding transcription factor DksA
MVYGKLPVGGDRAVVVAKKKTTKKKTVAKQAKSKRPKSKTAARKSVRVTTKGKKTVKKPAAKRAPKRAAAKPKTAKPKTAKPKTAKTTAPKRAKRAQAKPVPSRTARAPKAPKPTPVRKASSRLSPSEIDDFHIMLLQKRHELVGDMTTLTEEALHKNSHEASGNLSNMPQHMAELGSDNYEQEFALILVDGERALLKEIDEALRRIAIGGFGICEATGKPIGKARLRAKPWAKYCYEYVLAQETGKLRRY